MMRRTKSRLGKGCQERAGLRWRIDDVVVGAMDQQNTYLVMIDGRIADRRRLEIEAAILHRRDAEEFLDDPVIRTGCQIVSPLSVHVVHAIEADHAFDVGGNRGVGVVTVGRRVLVSSERNKRGEMRAGGIADETDAIRVKIEFGGLGAHELDRRFGIVNRCGIRAGLAQPVFDGENRIAGARQEQTPVAVKLPAANLPAAAMDSNQNRHLGAAFG